jgi:hypothetical protein
MSVEGRGARVEGRGAEASVLRVVEEAAAFDLAGHLDARRDAWLSERRAELKARSSAGVPLSVAELLLMLRSAWAEGAGRMADGIHIRDGLALEGDEVALALAMRRVEMRRERRRQERLAAAGRDFPEVRLMEWPKAVKGGRG